MAVFPGPLNAVYLEIVLSLVNIRCSNGSEIRIEHDAVTGLASFKSGEGLVDLTHREVLGLHLCD
jgi:hypothetical protein